MNFRKLLTYLTMGTAAVMPIATAQNPTILQGNYITNVFGNSNFVLNPNAQTNIANVTVSNATVTRSTTTPLVATSEFTVTTSTATGSATWSTRTFDAGMKNQNCEARFSYRGFSVGSTTAQILQGANVVAQLTLTASTDPRIASINFPCGDLSSATTFKLQQATASLTGTNEIGGIYVGLATNMANVAQAEFVGGYTVTGFTTAPSTASASFANLTSGNFTATLNGKATSYDAASASVTFSYLPAGTYQVNVNALFYQTASGTSCRAAIKEDTSGIIRGNNFATYSTVEANGPQIGSTTFDFTTGASRTFRVQMLRAVGAGNCALELAAAGTFATISVYRFPSSSELVVTPERQNVYGGVIYTDSDLAKFNGTAEPTSFEPYNNAVFNAPTKLVGKAAVTTSGSGNDLGFSIPNLPVGKYKVSISGLLMAGNNNSADALAEIRCNFRIVETDSSGTLRSTIARQTNQDFSISTSTADETRDYNTSFFGIYDNTAVATRNFRLEAQKFTDTSTGNTGICQAFSNEGTNTYNTNIAFLLEPLDQPSNSALYVQGPVLGAQTGATIPAGSVGELKEAQASTISVTTSATTITSLSLTPGVWLVNFNAQGDTLSAAFECGVATATNSSTGWDVKKNYAVQVGAASSYPYAILANYYLSVTATTTYYLTCKVSAGTVNSSGRFHAVRIN